MKKLYIGNLPFQTTDQELEQMFSQHGTVASASVITDKMTGRSRGFGFVEMENDEEADAAIKTMDGSDYDGRPLTVNEARPRVER